MKQKLKLPCWKTKEQGKPKAIEGNNKDQKRNQGH